MTTSSQDSGLWTRLARYFLACVFAVLPLVITVVAISWAIGFMAQLVGPDTFLGGLLSKVGLNFATNPMVAGTTDLIFCQRRL